MNEKNELNLILLDTPPNRILFRNNVGLGWTGKAEQCGREPRMIEIYPGDMVLRQARPLHAGLCKGSSDLIGWEAVKITQDMVGSLIARFVALEVKTGKVAVTEEQENFLEQVRKAGGVGEIIRRKA